MEGTAVFLFRGSPVVCDVDTIPVYGSTNFRPKKIWQKKPNDFLVSTCGMVM